MRLTVDRCIGGTGDRPFISGRIVSTACPILAPGSRLSAPDDHFSTGPHRSVKFAPNGRVRGAGGRPGIDTRIVSAAVIQQDAGVSAPDDHFAAGPDCGVRVSWLWSAVRGSPTVVGASTRLRRYKGQRIVCARCRNESGSLRFRSGAPGLQRLLAPCDCRELHAVLGFLK